jgi:hypothetical protein
MKTRREFLHSAIGTGALSLAFGSRGLAKAHASAISEAVRFVAAHQSPDGAWRSQRYGAFRDGDALTPLVLWALPEEACFARGLRWLELFTDALREKDAPWTALRYPLFTAGYAAQVFARVRDHDRADCWADLIEKLQVSSALGWPHGVVEIGAWSDSPIPPTRPAGQGAAPDMIAPNLSATLLAVQALAAGGRHEKLREAQRFVEACQNFAGENPGDLDDGGFFFALDDPVRNKAGVAGRDVSGRQRYRSYGSATCDGLLALRILTLELANPRFTAACTWLRQNSAGLEHSGLWPVRRATARESLAFYHGQALAAVLEGLAGSPHDSWATSQMRLLQRELISRQQRDGSWTGTAPDSCEDDPLVATAFALRALHLTVIGGIV